MNYVYKLNINKDYNYGVDAKPQGWKGCGARALRGEVREKKMEN